MSEQQNHHQHRSSGPPYKTLGKYLKSLRQKFQESLGETSGAVEILVEQLDRFERGSELPSEDVLLLLISHFGVQDDEAVEMWELAGYDGEYEANYGHTHERVSSAQPASADEGQLRQAVPVMLLALDNRVLYSNGVEVVSDDAGLILNFTQDAGQVLSATGNGSAKSQALAVSRIGMSHEQAKELMAVLERALLHKKYLSGPKQLPPPLPS